MIVDSLGNNYEHFYPGLYWRSPNPVST